MDAKTFFRSFLKFLVFPGIPLLILIIFISIIITLGFMHDAYPDEYNKFITNLLGLSGGTWYSLPDNVEDFIISLGFDPAVVANEIMANRWINENGGGIDLGIQLAIL